jgi:hypothetical protein
MCYYDQTNIAAGTEGSSTYEGRHLTIVESELRHPYHADGLVDKGEPVIHTTVTGHIVGVAFNSAAAATDYIAIDTEGIWYLSVRGFKDGAVGGVGTGATINPGDQIFINFTTSQTYAGTLSGISDFETQLPFGYALDGVVSGTTEVIAVKVHANFYGWDLYHSNAGATMDNGMSMTMTDAGTAAADMGTGIYVTYTNDGDKTGSATIQAMNLDMFMNQNIPYAYGLAVYMATSGNPTVGYAAGITVYMDDPGTAMSNYVGIDVQMALTGKTVADRHAFMRLRNQTAELPDAVFLLEGSGTADYLVHCDVAMVPAVPVVAGGGLANMKFAVRVAGVTYYIPTYVS